MAHVIHSPAAVPPRSIGMDASVRQLRRAFQRHQVRDLPVVDRDQHVMGMVSQRDLAKALDSQVDAVAPTRHKNCDDLPVSQIMSRQVLALEDIESPEAALRAMVAHRLHAVPITRHGQLVGIVTVADFLMQFAAGQWAGHSARARDRMSAAGQIVEGADPLARALEIAQRERQEYVVVVKRHRPLGILSYTAMREFLTAARSDQKRAELNSTAVRLLAPPLPSLLGELPLRNTATRMLEAGARVLPVVDRARMLMGVLHDDEILRAIVDALDANA